MMSTPQGGSRTRKENDRVAACPSAILHPTGGREEAAANTASTAFDLQASQAASRIPGSRVVIVTTGLLWDQKAQCHSTLNEHMENVDFLISEEAQQDMDLKSAFAPAVPRRPFFRAILGDFFLRECGRHVGGVPRSSLKERKHCKLMGKQTKNHQRQNTKQNTKPTPKQTQKNTTADPQPMWAVFPLY